MESRSYANSVENRTNRGGYRHCDCERFKKAEEEKRIKKWEETVAKAKEVQESDVKTYLYCEEFDSYHPEVDDFFEEYERKCSDEETYTRPIRLWVCSETQISIDAGNVIESACDDLHEDVSENCDYKSLQKLLDGWCKEQAGTTTYYPCYKEYVNMGIDYTIISKPAYIQFECPHCHEDVEIPFGEVDYKTDYWGMVRGVIMYWIIMNMIRRILL